MNLSSAAALLFTFSILPALPASATDGAWRCGDRLVVVGDLTAEVRARCGEPMLVESRTKMRKLRDERGREKSKISNVEEWSYRKDERELLRTLVFEDGRLVSIVVGARPVTPENTNRCERQMFSIGAPAAELKLACGEPASQDRWVEYVEEEKEEGVFVGRSITRERLVYNFGPQRFLRIFELAEGRLIKQTTGGYGYEK